MRRLFLPTQPFVTPIFGFASQRFFSTTSVVRGPFIKIFLAAQPCLDSEWKKIYYNRFVPALTDLESNIKDPSQQRQLAAIIEKFKRIYNDPDPDLTSLQDGIGDTCGFLNMYCCDENSTKVSRELLSVGRILLMGRDKPYVSP